MGYMSEEKIFKFLRELKDNLIKYEDKHGEEMGSVDYSDACVRYGSKIAYLESMVFICDDIVDAFEPADISLEEFYDDPYTDIYISCEGGIYEWVYGYESRGGDERKKDFHDAFSDAAENNGLTMDFCGGALAFQSEESWDRQNADEKAEREKMDEEFRRLKEN